MRILVADTHAAFAAFVVRMLSTLEIGDQVDEANTLEDLEIKLAYNGYTHLFINVSLLPVHYGKAIVVGMSALPYSDSEIKAMGADIFLKKPFTLQEFKDVFKWQKR